MERPSYWKLLKEAVTELGGKVKNKQIVDWITSKYPDAKPDTIQAQINACSVNRESRINYPENHKERTTPGNYDVLFSLGSGEVELYDPQKHGKWGITKHKGEFVISHDGKLITTHDADEFFFIEKDFKSTTGKKEDEQYLHRRFKTLHELLKKNLSSNFNNSESYVSHPFNQGSKKWNNYVWTGFARDGTFVKDKYDSVQFQVSLNKEDDISTMIWIDHLAKDTRKYAAKQIQEKKDIFFEILKKVPKSYYVGVQKDDEESDLEIQISEINSDHIKQISDRISKRKAQFYIVRYVSESEAIKIGTNIVNEISRTFDELIPAADFLGIKTKKSSHKIDSENALTFKEAAIKILEEAKEPLHYTEITKRAIQNNLITSEGKTPELSLLRDITEDIRINKEKSIFKKKSEGVYYIGELQQNYFLAMGPWSNWEFSLSKKPFLWGVQPDKSGTNIAVFNQLELGDIVFLYVSKHKPSKFSTYGIFGVGRIARKCSNEKEPYWPDEIQEGKAKYTHRFEIEPIKIIENDDDILWFDGLPNVKGLNVIKSDNRGLEPLLDAVKNNWNKPLNTPEENCYLIKNNISESTIKKTDIDKIFDIYYIKGIHAEQKNKYVVLFHSQANVYHDEIGPEIITYTGEGKPHTLDQKETGGNLAIIDSKKNGKKLYFLDEKESSTRHRTHEYEFLGEVEYLVHYTEFIPSENRHVIKFLLKRTNGPRDLKPIKLLSGKSSLNDTWNPGSNFDKLTSTIKMKKEIIDKYNIQETDTVEIELEGIPVISSFSSGFEMSIPKNVQKFISTKDSYSCRLIQINPTPLKNFRTNDFTNQEDYQIPNDSKIIEYQKVGDDLYFYGYGHVGNFVQEQCTTPLRNLFLPITSKISPFCSDPILNIDEIQLKEKLEKIITDATYGISGQKSIVVISILYWLSKTKFNESSLVEYLKSLNVTSDGTSITELELLVHNSRLFTDYVLIYKLYQSLGLMKFEIVDRIGYHIKQSLEMNNNANRLISDFSKNNLDALLSVIEPDRAKILLYNLLKEYLDESTLADFWNGLYGNYFSIKCSSEILEEIKNQPNFEPESHIIQINQEIYGKLLSQFSEISQTKVVSDGKLRIPTKNEIKKGIKEIQKELLIDDSIIEEVVTHLASGRHVLLAGPVGTGKTRLSQLIPETFWKENCGYFADVHTATADWSTYDVIGGLTPKMNSDAKDGISYEIEKGCVTKTIFDNYDKEKFDLNQFERSTSIHKVKNNLKEFHGTWLIIDEFNRADIDKAFGQLFTALEYKKLQIPSEISKESFRTIPIPEDYRIIGTLNTADKHFLFNLSDALKRRFAYVEISIPLRTDKNKEREIYLATKNGLKDLDSEKFIDIVKVHENPDSIEYLTDKLKNNIEYSYNVLELIREFKPLGTAILKAIYQTLLVSEKMENKDSFDNAINANLIPQIETLPKPTLRILYEYLFGTLEDNLKKETHKDQFQAGFEAILKYLKYTEKEIETNLNEFKNGVIPDNLETKIDKMKTNRKISFIDSSLFKRSLEDILKQSEF